jgi:ubiquinone/menaquinone biosynthesis C-methylase UbiE
MRHIHLLDSLPKPKRNIEKRLESKDPKVIAIAKQYGQLYWDGPRDYGYGGYYYDGRWRSVAKDIIDIYELRDGHRILDVGCGKGFLLKDLLLENKNLNVFGLDISQYAINNSEEEVFGRIHLGTAESLPFPDNSFDFVISLNTIHNFKRNNAIKAVKEIERVSKGKSFIQVDSYYNEKQKEIFESWVLTAEYYDYPEEWLKLYKEAGYTGDYDWTIIE